MYPVTGCFDVPIPIKTIIFKIKLYNISYKNKQFENCILYVPSCSVCMSPVTVCLRPHLHGVISSIELNTKTIFKIKLYDISSKNKEFKNVYPSSS